MKKNTLREFLLSFDKDKRSEFAKKCGTTLGMMVQIYLGNRKCNPALAIEIDKHSGGAVKCDELCPDVDFNYIRQQPKTP